MSDSENKYDVIIVGGGLAGLVSSILLSNNSFKVLLFEKRVYPFHKVCGEYVSNEVLPFLISLGLNPEKFGASKISRFRMSDLRGNCLFANLGMGGFGLSRFTMDYALSQIARESGVMINENEKVKDVVFLDNYFEVKTSEQSFQSEFVIGAYGKRDSLDKQLQRKFISKHTGYMGVKYHIRTGYPVDEIGIDHFPDGYCGIVKIEEEKYNLCYLYKRNSNYRFNSIKQLEEVVLFTNPRLKEIFTKAEFISEEPLVINEINFEKKECISNHIFFAGDTAGLITPLCGNGMAMAIHGALLLSNTLINNHEPGKSVTLSKRNTIEELYRQVWTKEFSNRLFAGRVLQRLSGKSILTTSILKLMKNLPGLKDVVIKSTHGKAIAPVRARSAHLSHQTFHP